MRAGAQQALEARVETLEREILAVEPRRIRTKILVFRRGAEKRCATASDAHKFAGLDPVVELIDERDDLDVLIDSSTGARIIRAAANDPVYDALAEGVEVLDVEIACYPAQLEQILSDAPITATTGGTRAGKTRALAWWLFRQWLRRGHGVDDEHEIAAVFWWVRAISESLYKHAVLWLVQLWPDIWVGKRPTPTTLHPSLHAFDGSRFDFRHASNSGSKAGTNLRSESVEALVCDELSAVHAKENWHEMRSRVAQTAGPVAVAFTPTAGHWSADLAKQAPGSGGAITVRILDMFRNPWWPLSRMWIDLLAEGVPVSVLEEKILAPVDQIAAALEVVTDPGIRRRRFGEAQTIGDALWALWDPDTMIHRGPEPRGELEHGGDTLPNITGATFGKHFGQRHRNISRGGGKDFNTSNGVTVVFRVFGDPRRPLVFVFDEVARAGPTLVNAEAVAAKYPGLCVSCDPTGALSGRHSSHGSSSTTDAEELRMHGLPCEPANGWTGRGKGRRVAQLPQLDSINVMHRAMREGLLLVHPRCTGVIEAMTEMQANPDGTIKKVSGATSRSDRVSDYGDALRYAVWPLWRHFLMAETKVLR